jgi:hypothetical protein
MGTRELQLKLMSLVGLDRGRDGEAAMASVRESVGERGGVVGHVALLVAGWPFIAG